MSPEELAILGESPPVQSVDEVAVVRMAETGRTAVGIESMRITPKGPVLEKVEFVIEDEFGALGQPRQVPQRCQQCRRTSFSARPCAKCGLEICPDCLHSAADGQQTIYVCEACAKRLVWRRDNWG
jgi:hypothetical protein